MSKSSRAAGALVSENTAAQQAYYAIRERIITLILPPGSAVDESDLQEQLGVGLTPIREAVRRLAQERMLEIYPRRATLVARLGVQEVREIFEERLVLEPYATALAAQRVTEADITELVGIEDMLVESSREMHAINYLPMNELFHVTIARFARNSFLLDDIVHIQTFNHWLWNIYFESRGRHRIEFEPHEQAHAAMIAALRTRDVADAEAASRTDLDWSRRQLLQGLQEL